MQMKTLWENLNVKYTVGLIFFLLEMLVRLFLLINIILVIEPYNIVET